MICEHVTVTHTVFTHKHFIDSHVHTYVVPKVLDYYLVQGKINLKNDSDL